MDLIKKKKSPYLISWGVLILSVVMMLFGIWQGDAEDVLMKAIRICLECIGIG